MNGPDAERWEEYLAEKDAAEQDAFEEWCDEEGLRADSEEAALAWRAYCEEEARRSYEDHMIEEYEARMRDVEADYQEFS